jgi:CubicO group peptidase (beta-lactamase class C family)
VDPTTPGLAVRIVQGNEVVYNRTLGLANIEHDVPVQAHTAFRIGSATKHMACAVALVLARDGHIDIEAPISDYLPELPAYPVVPTVRQLMNNTSGVCDFLELLTASGSGLLRPVSWPTSCDLVARQHHLNSVPGEEFIYSAGGFLVLCIILERVSGKPTEQLFDELLFRPLGMESSTLLVNDRTIVPHMASPYLMPSPYNFVRGGWGLEAKGEGGVVSTLGDMAVWGRELLHPRVLGTDVVDQMITPLTYKNGVTGKYGLGLYTRDFDGWWAFGHGGRTPGMRAELALYPEADMTIVVLTNHHNVDPYGLGQFLAGQWLGSKKAGGGQQPDPEIIAGRFLNAAGDDYVEIRAAGATPQLATTSGWADLRWENDAWVPISATLDMRFTSSADGIENLSSGRVLSYRRIGTPPAYQAGDYVGSYRREDLGTTYKITETDGQLHLRLQGELGYFDTILECVAPDLFRAEPADPRASWNQPFLYFERESGKPPTSLRYSTDRTKGLRFERL